MANFLVDAGFSGGVDLSRQVALGSPQNDGITFPTDLRDSNNNTIDSNPDVNQLEILLLDGNDTLNGSSLVAGQTALIVVGNTGDDEITGSADTDSLFGGQDRDILFGGGGNDQLFGNLGDDFIVAGGEGDDSVFGGQGNDDVRGANGNDRVFGDRGNDTISGGSGIDTLTGGTETDQFLIDPTLEIPTSDPAFVDQIADFSIAEADLIILPAALTPATISISNLQSIGTVQGFVVAENGVDINGDASISSPLAVVVNNPNITRPLDPAVDFNFTL
ncbi:MAG: calcium-binding protein [Microcoleaceae cyanobacterium]